MTLIAELKRRNVLRVAAAYLAIAWLVIQIVGTLLPILPGEHPETVFRAVTLLLAICFPMALVVSWLYEFTPEGFKLDKNIDRSSPQVRDAGKRLDRVIIGILTCALAYFAVDKFLIDPARDARRERDVAAEARSAARRDAYGDSSIAVLPFVNMSSDADNEYFSDGISEELLNLLAKIPGLRVISRSSSFTFKGKDVDIREIATSLDVAHVLEGSVRKQGNRVRITAQLIEAGSDTHLWSETYDRNLDDIFAIQDEIAARIVKELKQRLPGSAALPVQHGHMPDLDAYEAFLRGRFQMNRRTVESVAAAVAEFERAVKIDPQFAPALAELALAIRFQASGMYGSLPKADAIARAEPYARRALELDPSLAEAHAAMGYLRVTEETMDEALAHFRDAIAANPSYSPAYLWLANFLDAMGSYSEYIAMTEKAAKLDPLSVPAGRNYAFGLMATGRSQALQRQIGRLRSTDPVGATVVDLIRQSRGGNWSLSSRAALEDLLYDPKSRSAPATLAWTLAVLGLVRDSLAATTPPEPTVYLMLDRPTAERLPVIAAATQNANSSWSEFDAALLSAGVGDYETARDALERRWATARGTVTRYYFDVYAAAALFRARTDAGERDKTQELVAAIRANIAAYEEAGIISGFADVDPQFDTGLVAYLEGRPEDGRQYVARAIDSGYALRTGQDYLRMIYDDPLLSGKFAELESRRSRERRRFLVLVCGDNPYATVWQPQPGSCRDHGVAP